MQPNRILELIQAEYAELPGLKLTPWQAQRLWHLSPDVCTAALKTLVDGHVLSRTGDGAYVRCWGTESQIRRDASTIWAFGASAVNTPWLRVSVVILFRDLRVLRDRMPSHYFNVWSSRSGVPGEHGTSFNTESRRHGFQKTERKLG